MNIIGSFCLETLGIVCMEEQQHPEEGQKKHSFKMVEIRAIQH